MSLRTRVAHVVEVNLAVQRRSVEIRGGTLAAAISMRAFLALFPIALLAIGVVGLVGGDPSSVSRDLAEALGGSVASSVARWQRASRPPRAAGSCRRCSESSA